MIYDVLLMRYWWLKKKENIMVQKWCICTILLFVLCSLVTRWDHLRKGNFSWGFPAFSWPVGKPWLILIWEGSSHYWRCHPLEDSYRSYKKAIWMNHGKQVIKIMPPLFLLQFLSPGACFEFFFSWFHSIINFNMLDIISPFFIQVAYGQWIFPFIIETETKVGVSYVIKYSNILITFNIAVTESNLKWCIFHLKLHLGNYK